MQIAFCGQLFLDINSKGSDQIGQFLVRQVSIIILFCVFVGVQGMSFASSAYGQTVNTFDSPATCASIQTAVSHLSASSSAIEWPKKLHIPGMFFPTWVKLAPSQALNLIEENYLAEQMEYLNSEMASPDPRLQKDLMPNAKQIDLGWNKYIKPSYLNAISRKQFEFQETSLSEISGQTNKIIVFRFRAILPHQPTIQIKMTPIDKLYNWEYLIRIFSDTNSYKDYPISTPPNPVQGEMAVIENSIVIFVTGQIINSELVEVYLPPGPIWWSGSGLPTSNACILNFR